MIRAYTLALGDLVESVNLSERLPSLHVLASVLSIEREMEKHITAVNHPKAHRLIGMLSQARECFASAVLDESTEEIGAHQWLQRAKSHLASFIAESTS